MSSRRTVVSEFVKLIASHENVFETPIDGVGSGIGLVDPLVGGISGWGTLRNVITALRNLTRHYADGDRIVLIGYSRGAWAARYLALLIGIIGLPKDGDARLYNRIYKACDRDSIVTREVAQELLKGYERWADVTIDALCCFDTVGSLGLPLTGLAKPLAFLGSRKKRDIDTVSEVSPNVRFAFHCLSLHEAREPYNATLMCGPSVHQVSFPGSHSNLGWIEDNEGLVHAPFAWMIQQLHTHLDINFDEIQLARSFPRYAPEQSAASTAGQPWFRGSIKQVNTGLLAIIGKKTRDPGHTASTEDETGLKVHIGARLRHGLDGANAVPGYTLMAPVTGRPYWERGNRSPLNWAERIEEAEVGQLESRLLGLPVEVAKDYCCHPHCSVFGEDVPDGPKEEVNHVTMSALGNYSDEFDIDSYIICWGAISPNQDWVINAHPHCEKLFIATAGSFHS
ncbi:hypothetical protein PG989_007013 [Apiospora arundinis]